jgi:hypothetical protein
VPQTDQIVPELRPGEQYIIDLDIDTSLRPDTYRLAATVHVPLSGQNGESPYHNTQGFEITIVPRPLPHTMPVVMWGGGLDQIDWLSELGFTHCIATWVDFNKIRPPRVW